MDAVHLFELIIAMLFAVIALHYLAHRLHLPPLVALIAGGAALAFIPGLPVIALDPALARAELLRLHRTGQIDDRVLHELERDLDLEELGALSAKAT